MTTAATSLATWQLAVLAVPCLVLIGFVLHAEARTRRVHRAREAENAATRAHIAQMERSRNQRDRAHAADRRGQETARTCTDPRLATMRVPDALPFNVEVWDTDGAA